ncbi:MAG: formylglycine-generating enzyme family protein [Myxococcota bacterium]
MILPADEQGDHVLISGATFVMGAQSTDPNGPNYDSAAWPDEGPPRRVTLSTYWLDAHEVTAGAVQECLEVGACAEGEVDRSGGFLNVGAKGHEDRPANGVTWQLAASYCAWRGGRLPTEAEWEFAARGPESERFPTGTNDPCSWSEFRAPNGGRLMAKPLDRSAGGDAGTNCAFASTIPTGSVSDRSAHGVFGLTSNVAEWVADWYGPAPAPSAESDVDPTGPATGIERVTRGGSWLYTDRVDLRAAARWRLAPDERQSDVGFRCAYAADWNPPAKGPRQSAQVGPLVVGDSLGDDWHIASLWPERGRLVVRIANGQGGGADLWLQPEAHHTAADLALSEPALYYRESTVPADDLLAPATQMSERVRAALDGATPAEAVQMWTRAALALPRKR